MVGANEERYLFESWRGGAREAKRDARGKETPDFVGAPLRERGEKARRKSWKSYELTFWIWGKASRTES